MTEGDPMDEAPVAHAQRPPHAWLGGRCVAMLHDLPNGTQWFDAEAGTWTHWWVDDADVFSNQPVEVVAWPDGEVPKPAGLGAPDFLVANAAFRDSISGGEGNG